MASTSAKTASRWPHSSRIFYIPLRILISSRVEPYLHQKLYASPQVRLLDLAERRPDEDIEAALDASIAKERQDKGASDKDLPAHEDKKRLVKHTGGSLIFMTVVIEKLFATTPRDGSRPKQHLPRVLEMVPDFDDFYIGLRCEYTVNFRIAKATRLGPVITIRRLIPPRPGTFTCPDGRTTASPGPSEISAHTTLIETLLRKRSEKKFIKALPCSAPKSLIVPKQ